MGFPANQSGETLPLIKAPAFPIKVRPINPGGMKIPYQDITVLNPGSKDAPRAPIKLRSPPEEPIAFPR